MSTEIPADWRQFLDQAEVCFREQRLHDCLQFCDRAAQHGEEARYFAAMLRGDALMELEDPAGALSSYESVADPSMPDPELDCARGIALFELGSLPEADNALRSALRGNSELVEAHYTLGLIAELLGTGEEVECFRMARRLDPTRFPAFPQMSRPEFEDVIQEALSALPEPVRQLIAGIPVLVAEMPHPDDLKLLEPPTPPTALGMFVGSVPGNNGPEPALLLFKRNLERAFREREKLVEEIGRTVVHELRHVMGVKVITSHDDETE